MPHRSSPHDKLFKEELANPKDAAAELRAVLPPGWWQIDPEVLANEGLRRMTPNFAAVLDDISFCNDAELRARGLSVSSGSL